MLLLINHFECLFKVSTCSTMNRMFHKQNQLKFCLDKYQYTTPVWAREHTKKWRLQWELCEQLIASCIAKVLFNIRRLSE